MVCKRPESSTLELSNLIIDSQVLKGGILGDGTKKHNYVLAPKTQKTAPLIVHLSGYFGNGNQSFNIKTLEENYPQMIARATQEKRIPLAVHVFVDGMTGMGGSQYINSDLGNFEDYLQKELVPAVEKHFSVAKDREHRCLIGTSSGGYGALHHISLEKTAFGVALASAPDSDFETSMLPDMYKAAPALQEYSSLKKIRAALADGTLRKKKNFFDVMNAAAMACCYSPLKKDEIQFPIDLNSGDKNEKVWKAWQAKDPVRFLEKRAGNLKDRFIYLEVGTFDEFSLYFGARKIKALLDKNKVPHEYVEFPGGHFDSNIRKVQMLEFLKRHWAR